MTTVHPEEEGVLSKEEQLKQYKRDWYYANKEVVNKRRVQWSKDNKDKRNAWLRQRVNCPHCGKEVSRGTISAHKRRMHTE